MGTFGPGILRDRGTGQPVVGAFVKAIDPLTGVAAETVDPLVTDSDGYWDQFSTVDENVKHVIVTDGRVPGIHVWAYEALSQVGAPIVLGQPVATAGDLPLTGNTDGEARVAQDTGVLWQWNGPAETWVESTALQAQVTPAAVAGTIPDPAVTAALDAPVASHVGYEFSQTRAAVDTAIDARSLATAAMEVTVGPGGQHATINAAIAALTRKRLVFFSGGLAANVRLLTGFVWAEQVRNYRQDLSWVTIVADDPTVTISRAALTTKYERWYPALMLSDDAHGPTLGCQLDMDSSGVATERVGAYVRNASTLVVNEGCGIINAAVRGVDCVSASTLHAQVTNWSGAGEIGVRISNGSKAQLTQSTVTGCGVVNLSVGGSCNVNATQCVLTGSLGRGIDMSGDSLLNADSVDVSNAAQEGVYLHSGTAQFTAGNAQNCGGYGVRAAGAAMIHAGREGTTFAATNVSGSAGGFLAEYGGTINAEGALANNCTADAVKAQHGGKIVMPSGQANDCTGRAFVADHGSELSINLASGQRATGVGLDVLKGSKAQAQFVNVSSSGATIGVRAMDGATINFNGGNARRGASDAAGDITVTNGSYIVATGATGGTSVTKNSLTVHGIIYDTAASLGAIAVPDATDSVKGVIQLAGDLLGTAAAPTVKVGTTGQAGKVRLASTAEAAEGTASTLAVTPAGLKGVADTKAGVGSTSVLNLYANASTGNDANDGLSSGSAVQTLAGVDALLSTLSAQQLSSPIVVNLTGSFTVGHTFTSLRKHPAGVTFQGQPLVGGLPVTTISKGAGSGVYGLAFDPSMATVTVNNIAFSGFTNGFNGYGVFMKGGGALTVNYCTATNCDTGFAAIRNVSYAVHNCTATNCTTGFMAQYSSSGSFNYDTATSCVRGFYNTRNSVGHIDYSTAEDCTVSGIGIDMASRVAVVESHLKRNATGVLVEGAGEWMNSDCLFYDGTADANTIPYAHYGVGHEVRMHAPPTTSEFRVYSSLAEVTTAAGVEEMLLAFGSGTAAIPAYYFVNPPKMMRCVITGTLVGTAIKSLGLYRTNSAGGAQASMGHLSTNGVGAFRMEVLLHALTATTQRATIMLQAGGGSTASGHNIILEQSKALNTAEEWRLRFLANSGNTSSSVTLKSVDFYISG